MSERVRRRVAGHYPAGDGWTCACGYDFFGGTAAYGSQLYEGHLRAMAQPAWGRRLRRLRYRIVYRIGYTARRARWR